nr:reverse transcriptase domain-containing protein [Tanacetum cinerariifolium]
MSQTERQEEEVVENASNKRKWESNHHRSLSQQNKGHNVPRSHTAWPINKKAHAGSLPLCNQCKFHHSGPCTVKCESYKKVGHIIQNFRTPATAKNQRTCTYYEYGSLRHYKGECPIVKFHEHVDMIHGRMRTSKPKTTQDVTEIVTKLRSKKISTLVECQTENKKRLDNTSKNNQNQQQPKKRQNIGRAYTARHGEKKHYGGSKPLCSKCDYHHDGPCAPKCHKCNRFGHIARDYFQNTFEPSNASTNVVNAPREPYDAHIGYNCPSKSPVISNPKPCNNQTFDELPQTLPIFHPTFQSKAESPFTLDSTPTYVDESPNVFNPTPQPPVYPCECYGNDAYYGHYCTPQAPFIYPEPCYNQDFNFPQDFQNVPQQYPCCDDCGVTHDAYQCQPMNEVYYYGQNSCYDSTSIGFDQSQPQQYTVDHPIFNAHNDYLDSKIQLNSTLAKITKQMTSITSLCEMACQLPVYYDDDDDEERSDSLDDNIISGLPPFSAITPNEPVLSTEEPDKSLSMGDEQAPKLDEFIKSGVENLIPIPSESEGIPEHMCDVPSHDNSSPLDVSKDQIKDFFEPNKEFSL